MNQLHPSWVTIDKEVVHPNAPRGGGGEGMFRNSELLGLNVDDGSLLPHPQSPSARYVVENKKDPEPSTPIYLHKEVYEEAKKYVGKPTVRTTTPQNLEPECYDLVDKIFTKLDAQHPRDLTPKGGEFSDADYVWGEKIELSEVKPGDILQLRDHQIHVKVDVSTHEKYPNGTEIDDGDEAAGIDEKTYKRGHHTAIVSESFAAGVIDIIEQHVTDRKKGGLTKVVLINKLQTQSSQKVRKEVKDKKHAEFGKGTLTITTTTTITVTGTIWTYRAIKENDDSETKK